MYCLNWRTLLILIGALYFTDGKACPEKSRPHKTRCELYYKCMEIPTQTHVWVPEKCEKGLVYVHSLKICALPGDDWECNLDEAQSQQLIDNKVNKFQQPHKKSSNKDSDVYVVSNGAEESNFIEPLDDGKIEVVLKSTIGRNDENDEDIESYESSGDGIDFKDGFLEASTREGEVNMNLEAQEMMLPSSTEQSTTTKVDPSLKAHLDRLSQLIGGLQKTYKNRDKESEDLTPDQLNAFLAHFNIKNNFNTLNIESTDTDKKNSISVGSTSTPPIMHPPILNASDERDSAKNDTEISHIYKLNPETKVILSNTLPKRFGSSGYSNSQIVVNRPEGSVLFSLPQYGNEDDFIDHQMQYNYNYNKNSPKISEETLKTVLELSKQMIANQHVPKVIPNPTYYAQPIIQPLFLPPSSYATSGQSSANSPFSAYFNDYENHDNPTSTNYHRPNKKPNRPQNIYSGKPGTTIIHNNVIPVHVTSTNSDEKDILDSYGNKIGIYPPLGSSNIGNNNNDYAYKVTHQYVNNKFVSTVRPIDNGQFSSPYDGSLTTLHPPLEYTQPTTSSSNSQYYTPTHYSNEASVQYENIKHHFDLNRPDSIQNTYQQVERPSSYQGVDKLFSFSNGEKFESMETDDQSTSYGNSRPQINNLQFNSEQLEPSSSLSNIFSNSKKHPYLPRPEFLHNSNRPKFPGSNGDPSQLVNIGGNFISYDVFQNSILPLIGQSGNSGLEVISCQAGIRQPNMTDCTRYYVCSKKDGKVLSYSCPPFTAFNGETRICDARTYANCAPNAIMSGYTVSENKRIQLEAIKALNEAKKRREEALKAQKITNLLQQYNAQLSARPSFEPQNNYNEASSSNANELNSYVQQAAALTTPPPPASTTTKPSKKYKYYCKEGDKVPDQSSTNSYFVCYKNAQGVMKGHKMTCTKGLVFCAKTKMCTLPVKCT